MVVTVLSTIPSHHLSVGVVFLNFFFLLKFGRKKRSKYKEADWQAERGSIESRSYITRNTGL